MSQQTPAYLLTRHWRDTPNGIELVYWAQSDAGPVRLVYKQQKAVCFIRRDCKLAHGSSGYERKPLQLTDLQGHPVDGLYFEQQRRLQQLREICSKQDAMLLESDIKPADRYLMERYITAPMRVTGTTSQQHGYLQLENARLQPSKHFPQLSYISFDIETRGFDPEIISIAFCNPEHQEIHMRGDATYWPTELPITWHQDEASVIKAFLQRVQALDPDLLLGWNVINFDLDLLQQRCRHHQIPFMLGRGNEAAAVLQPGQSGQARVASIPGRVALDGIDNLKAAFWQFESFALGKVAQQLLGRDKLIESDQNKVEEINRLYQQDRPALAAYNLEDCRLVEDIFQHTDLISFAVQRAAMTGLPLGRQGGSVAAFDNLYLPRLHRAGAVAFDTGAIRHQASSPGGYVLESQPGLYDNVLVLDFKSLYPSIIRTFKIDPYGLNFPDKDPIPGFLGAHFRRHDSILPGIIEELWQQRDQAKQEQNQPLSQAIKIIMNSFYGVLGSNGCRFHDPKLASSITRRGHEIIRKSKELIEQQGYQVIYGDTDSVFVLLGKDFSVDQAKQAGNKIATHLNQWWQQHIRDQYALESALEIEFETHFVRFLMPTIRGAETGSKKRYAGVIETATGDQKLVFKGLESVRSDWTPLAKSFQQELYQRIFFNQAYEEFISTTVARLNNGELDSQLIYSKRLRRRLQDYQKNIPPHVQAARKMKKAGRTIRYLITLNGPEPYTEQHSRIDYQHYIDRQLAPVADGILHFVGDSFERITADQLSLFQ